MCDHFGRSPGHRIRGAFGSSALLSAVLAGSSPQTVPGRLDFTSSVHPLLGLLKTVVLPVARVTSPTKRDHLSFNGSVSHSARWQRAADSESRGCARRLVLLQGCSSLRCEATQPRTLLDETSPPRAPRAQSPPPSDVSRADRFATAGPRLQAPRSKPPSFVYTFFLLFNYLSIYIYIYTQDLAACFAAP